MLSLTTPLMVAPTFCALPEKRRDMSCDGKEVRRRVSSRKPGVLTLARLFEMVWTRESMVIMPAVAAYMPRIMVWVPDLPGLGLWASDGCLGGGGLLRGRGW